MSKIILDIAVSNNSVNCTLTNDLGMFLDSISIKRKISKSEQTLPEASSNCANLAYSIYDLCSKAGFQEVYVVRKSHQFKGLRALILSLLIFKGLIIKSVK